jgi:type VI secretion system protein ImpB
MAKEITVAPKERINIKYVPSTNGQQEEVELPLKLLVTGDFKGRPEDCALEDRQPISVNKETFDSVLREQNLSSEIQVQDRLSESAAADAMLPLSLQFRSLEDFSPDSIARQVPELQKLLELREALVALKGALGNIPAFRAKIAELVSDDEARARLVSELNFAPDDGVTPSKK